MEPPPGNIDRTKKEYGDQLLALRRLAGLSQAALARQARLSVRTISYLEKGGTSRPWEATHKALVRTLAIRLQERLATGELPTSDSEQELSEQDLIHLLMAFTKTFQVLDAVFQSHARAQRRRVAAPKIGKLDLAQVLALLRWDDEASAPARMNHPPAPTAPLGGEWDACEE